MNHRQSLLPQVFDESETYQSPERRLMLAVILAAVNDALGLSPANHLPEEREHHKRLARQWFERKSRDFQIVCLAAGMEPDTVRTRALAYIDAGDDGRRVIANKARPPKPQREKSLSGLNSAQIKAIAERAQVCAETARRVVNKIGNVTPRYVARVEAAYAQLHGERLAA